jgi:methyltransferase, FkbM family
MSPKISYAQNGEDIILERLFGDQETGFYIDIGASHPEFLSVTKRFYDKGWHGINVDPLPQSIDLFLRERPRDLNLNVAIAKEAGVRLFHQVTDYPELSTFSQERIEGAGHTVVSYPVEIIPGDKLFEHCDSEIVDFLKIDVEGAESEVIESIDFTSHRPRVIVAEATIPDSAFPGWRNFKSILTAGQWEPLLLRAGYLFAYFDGLNNFYVREEDKSFLECFPVGLCCWDDYVPHAYASRIEELEWHCNERMKQITMLTEMVKKLQNGKG